MLEEYCTSPFGGLKEWPTWQQPRWLLQQAFGSVIESSTRALCSAFPHLCSSSQTKQEQILSSDESSFCGASIVSLLPSPLIDYFLYLALGYVNPTAWAWWRERALQAVFPTCWIHVEIHAGAYLNGFWWHTAGYCSQLRYLSVTWIWFQFLLFPKSHLRPGEGWWCGCFVPSSVAVRWRFGYFHFGTAWEDENGLSTLMCCINDFF